MILRLPFRARIGAWRAEPPYVAPKGPPPEPYVMPAIGTVLEAQVVATNAMTGFATAKIGELGDVTIFVGHRP